MTSALMIGGALANCGANAPEQEFLQFLADGAPDVPMFRFTPRPGTIVAAALDWQGVLGTGADLIAYGGLLWAAYQRFVKPRLEQHNAGSVSPFLFIAVRRSDGESVQFQLGREYEGEDAFISDFESQVSALRNEGQGPDDLELLWDFEQNETWTPYGPGRRHS